MTRDEILKVLVEFFRDAFHEDPIGVGEWFASGGQNIDDFIDDLNKWKQMEGRGE